MSENIKFICYKFTFKNKNIVIIFDNLVDVKRQSYTKYVEKWIPDKLFNVAYKSMSGLIYYKVKDNKIKVEYILTFLRGKKLFYTLFNSILGEKASTIELVNLANFNIYHKLGFYKKNYSLEKKANKNVVDELLSTKEYPKVKCNNLINLDANQMKDMIENVDFLFIFSKTY